MPDSSFPRWKFAAVIALLFAPAQSFAQVQIIRPGDFPDTPVENTLRQKCEREWPDDFRMRAYCENNSAKQL
jgi:hypothetical protein